MPRWARYSAPPKSPADWTARKHTYSRSSDASTRTKTRLSAAVRLARLSRGGLGWRRLYRKPKRKGVSASPQTSFCRAVVKWARRKARRSSVTAANSASAEASTGTSSATSSAAPKHPRTTGTTRRETRLFSPGARAAGTAPRCPNRPRSRSQNRSHSMAGRHQGSRTPPERARAWTGSSTSRAIRFQSRKYQLEPRASVTARNRLNSSRARLERTISGVGPVMYSTRAYQANTAAVRPAVGPCHSRVSANSTQNTAVNSSTSRSLGRIS